MTDIVVVTTPTPPADVLTIGMQGPAGADSTVPGPTGPKGDTGSSALVSAGVTVTPTLTDNHDGTITVGEGSYNLFHTSSGTGEVYSHVLTGGLLPLVDGITNYVVVDYNGGTPVIYVTGTVGIINETTIIPIYTIYLEGTTIHMRGWDELGNALVNKLHQSIVKTSRYRRESGLALTEAGTRNVIVGEGVVWIGAVRIAPTNYTSISNPLTVCYHTSGSWVMSPATQYDNFYYDNGTNRVELTPNRYAVNFVYLGVEENEEAFIVLGSGDYKLGDALTAQPPADLPPLISSHAILVGRIVVLKSASTATQIDSAFVTNFTQSPAGDHESLANLLGGGASDHYHLTSTQHTSVTAPILASIVSIATTGIIAITSAGVAAARTITGTENQVSVLNGDGVGGNPTISLPQNIHSGASPTFAGLTVKGALNLDNPVASAPGLILGGSVSNIYKYSIGTVLGSGAGSTLNLAPAGGVVEIYTPSVTGYLKIYNSDGTLKVDLNSGGTSTFGESITVPTIYGLATTAGDLNLRGNSADLTTGRVHVLSTLAASAATAAFLVDGGGTFLGSVWAGSGFVSNNSNNYTSLTDGLVLQNGLTATAGQPYTRSTRLRFGASAWDLSGTPAAKSVRFCCDLIGVSSTTPGGLLSFSSSIDNAAFVDNMTLSSGGLLTVPTITGSSLTAGILHLRPNSANVTTGIVKVSGPILVGASYTASALPPAQNSNVAIAISGSYSSTKAIDYINSADANYPIMGRIAFVGTGGSGTGKLGGKIDFYTALEDGATAGPVLRASISSSGIFSVTSTTASTGTTSGCATFAGGVGIVGAACAGTARFGGASDYTSFEADGTLLMVGAATVYEDLRFPATAINPAGSATPMTFDQTEVGFLASASATQTIACIAQMPHSWKEGSNIEAHIHWGPTGTGSGNVVWRLAYKWQNREEADPGSWTTLTDLVVAADGAAFKHQMDSFGTISGSGKTISSILTFQLSRVGGDAADTYAANAILKEFDLHYESDALGSRTPTSK